VAQRILKSLARGDRPISACRIGILGLTFKENVPDTRNSRVPDIIAELRDYGVEPLVDDAFASDRDVAHLGLTKTPHQDWQDLDGLILAVPHAPYLKLSLAQLLAPLRPHGLVFDVKSRLNRAELPDGVLYMAL
jgi:UDP-N-acetyl-D-galactosamine dehydrogenase